MQEENTSTVNVGGNKNYISESDDPFLIGNFRNLNVDINDIRDEQFLLNFWRHERRDMSLLEMCPDTSAMRKHQR